MTAGLCFCSISPNVDFPFFTVPSPSNKSQFPFRPASQAATGGKQRPQGSGRPAGQGKASREKFAAAPGDKGAEPEGPAGAPRGRGPRPRKGFAPAPGPDDHMQDMPRDSSSTRRGKTRHGTHLERDGRPMVGKTKGVVEGQRSDALESCNSGRLDHQTIISSRTNKRNCSLRFWNKYSRWGHCGLGFIHFRVINSARSGQQRRRFYRKTSSLSFLFKR